MSHIQKIKDHLKLSNKLDVAAAEVLIGNDVQATAIKYGLNQTILNRKISIVKKMENYLDLKSKFELAVKKYLDGKTTIKAAADRYKISHTILTKEIRFIKKHRPKYIYETAPEYVYEGPSESKAIFTFNEEARLMWDLCDWKFRIQPYCFCQLCALDRLLIIAKQYARYKGKIHLIEWNGIEGINWLLDFEMKFSFVISMQFYPNCIKVPTIT